VSLVYLLPKTLNLAELIFHETLPRESRVDRHHLERVLDAADCVQVMTVHPGFSGQRFMEDQLSKIQRLRQEIDQRHLKASIVVDGGIDAKTAPLAVKSGATVLVAGSSVYNQSAPVAQNVLTLRNSIAATVAAIGSD